MPSRGADGDPGIGLVQPGSQRLHGQDTLGAARIFSPTDRARPPTQLGAVRTAVAAASIAYAVYLETACRAVWVTEANSSHKPFGN